MDCHSISLSPNLRFTSLTNAFSKKLDNHIHALALYFAFYNFSPHPQFAAGHARDGCRPNGSRLVV